MMLPIVSVLMPVYNATDYIQEAIESILHQTLREFEFIIINDGSTDDSLSMIELYSCKDSRIKVIDRENKGVAKTRNDLVAMARCKYIAWMDADDISFPNRLEVMYNFMNSNRYFSAIGCGTILIDQEGMEICKWNQPGTHEAIDAMHLAGRGGAIIFPSSMMNLDIVKTVGGFREDLTGAEDFDLFLKIAEIGKVCNIETPLFKYRQNLNSLSHAKRAKIVENTNDVLAEAFLRRGITNKKICNEAPESNIYQTHQKWAWWALAAGNKKTARKHAWISFCRSPFSFSSYRVLACTLRGY